MDASTVIRLRVQFPNTKVLTSTGESPGHDLDFRWGIGATYIFQLVANTKTWVGLNWGSTHAQHLVVGNRYCSIFVHRHYHVRWCLEWIFMAGILRLV